VGRGVEVAAGGASVGGIWPCIVGATVETTAGVLVLSGIPIPHATSDNNNSEMANNLVTRIG
jgi:hypothetical protein